MEFSDAAQHFDNDPVYDGYTDELLFYCHTTPHDDHTSSGATSRRRTMTTADGTEPPARAVVKVYDDHWLVSDSNPDGFLGVNVRRSYGLKKSTGLMDLLTPAQACAGAAGLPLHAHCEYYRDMADAHTSADWSVMWNIFTAPDEPIARGSFLRQGSRLFRVRSSYPSIEKYQISESDEFDPDALQLATFTTTGTVDLVTDQQQSTALVLPVIQSDSMKFYRYRTQIESDTKPGDRVVFVAASSAAPQPGSNFTMLGHTWRVLSAVIEGDARVLRVRMA